MVFDAVLDAGEYLPPEDHSDPAAESVAPPMLPSDRKRMKTLLLGSVFAVFLAVGAAILIYQNFLKPEPKIINTEADIGEIQMAPME